MTRNSYVRLLAIAALLLLPGALHAAQQQQPESRTRYTIGSRTTVRYTIRFMDLHDAEVLAWDQCGKPAERCRVASLAVGDASTKGYLEVLAEAAVHEKIARALAQEDGVPRTQSFQVLLLHAGSNAGSSGMEVPANAQKALSDLKGFLPFKNYQLLDALWMRATQDRITEGRAMAGRGGPEYMVRLRFRNVGKAEDRNLFVDTFWLREEAATPRPPESDKKESSPVAPKPSRDVISTSFNLKTGETIVVGTSKVDGADEALVVLLTAVPPP